MDAEIFTEALKDGVGRAVKVAQKHLSLPILSCLLLRAEGESLYISATNLEIGAEIKIPAKVKTAGTIAVPGDTFWNLISQVQNVPNIKLETVDEKNLSVSIGSSEGVIKLMPHDDFPTIPSVSNPVGSFTIKSGDLSNLIKSVSYSTSQSSIKPELSSILFYVDEEGMFTVAATDLFRLAEKKISIKKITGFEKMLISVKNITEINRIFQDITEDIDIIVKDNQVAFIAGDIYVVSRTVDSAFPDYKQIIPHEYKTEVILLKQDLIHALKILRVFTDKLQHLKFHIVPKDNIFEVSMKNVDIGTSTSKIPAKIEGESLDIAFNFRYITDVLTVIPEDSIRLEFNGVGKAVVVRGSGNHTFLYLVMPLVTKQHE